MQRILAMAASASGLIMAPGNSAIPHHTRFEPAKCVVIDPQAPKGSTEIQALCGTFVVPENDRRSSGRKLPLRVVVLPAKSTHPGLPVYVLPGGPGQRTTSLVSGYANSLVRQNHDVVFMDLRGAGDGHWLGCHVGGSDENPTAYIAPLFSQGAQFASCRDELSKRADLNQYTVINAMRDLDSLRAALGHQEIMLLAGSYGTREALVYIRIFGSHVRAAVLVAAAPFQNRIPLYHAAAAQRSFDELVHECARAPKCRSAFPNMRGDLRDVLARLRRAPAEVTISNPATGAPLKVTLTSASFGEGLRVMLYYDDTIAQVPLLLHLARDGQLRPFAQAAVDGNRALYKTLPLGMTLSYTCSDDVARIRSAEIRPATTSSFVGDSRVRGQVAACSVWPRHPVAPEYRGTFRSNVPVLFVSGTLDPVTPPSDGNIARRSFPSSRHVVFRGAHGAGGECLDRLTARVFDTTSVRHLDTSCVATTPPPIFAVPAVTGSVAKGK